MTRVWIGVVVAFLLAGCFSVQRVEQAEPMPAEPPGADNPELVLEIANRSQRDVDVTYRFESADGSASGEGMGTFPGCEAGSLPFGPVLGEFVVAIDGATVFEGTVPMAAADGFVILRLSIAEGGAVTANAPRWTPVEPVHRTTPIAGCG